MARPPKRKQTNIIAFPENKIVRPLNQRVDQPKKKPGPKPQPLKKFLETLYNDKDLVSRREETFDRGVFLAWNEGTLSYHWYISSPDVLTTEAVLMVESFKNELIKGFVQTNNPFEESEI